jgi:hypothetical protein
MEYLVTYGWALLALLFVIALLIGSGAFSISNFTMPECTFQPDLPCSSFIIYKENAPSGVQTVIAFNITNGLGFPMNITNITYSFAGWGSPGTITADASPPSPILVGPGESVAFSYNFTGANQPSERDFKTAYVYLAYYNCRSSSPCSGPYITFGRISSIVEKRY